MNDITRELLEQYYGFHDESINTDRVLSIHKCVNNINDCVEENTDKDVTLNENEQIFTKEDAKSDTDHDKKDLDDLSIHDSCLSDTEEKEDQNIISESHISLESYFVDNVLNNEIPLNSVSDKDDNKVSYPSSVPEELCTSELCPLSADDGLDTVSDVSLVVVQQPSRKPSKHYVDLPPLPDKVPVYNSRFIDVSNAKLTTIPNNIFQQYSGIRMLYLDNNSLLEIPDELFPSLQNLEWLDIRNNQLQCLPKSIKSHPSLHTFLLQGNKIQVLPLELCLVPKLKNLQVANNPLVMPPENIVVLGCSNILNFLKDEWNKLHPDEIIIPVKEVKPKSLTVLGNELINKRNPSVSQVVNCYSCNDIPNKVDKISVTEKRKAYKPSNWCGSKGLSIKRQMQLQWINEITEMLNKEAAALQKIKDKIALQDWKDDKSSFQKSMSKAAKRGEGDIPFAVDISDDLSILKAKNRLRKHKVIFVPPSDINKEIIKLLESLNETNKDDDDTNMTPTSKQKLISDRIKKIHIIQDEIRHLQRYNDATIIP